MTGTLDLIHDAQQGDELAMTRLLLLIKIEHMPRHVHTYRGRNVTVTDDDIESEFMVAAWKAVGKAKLDIGNPLNFICWKAKNQVASLFRNRIKKEVRMQCLECGYTGTMGWREKVPVCKECDSTDIKTWMVAHSNNSTVADYDKLLSVATGVTTETAWNLAVYNIEVEELHRTIGLMRERLDGRALDLFDLIVFEGIHRENYSNYTKEVARRWGVNPTAVAAALRRLRRDLTAFLNERRVR